MSALSGMKEITQHCQRSEMTIMKWIRNFKFPAKKLGGVWESDTDLIAEWRKLVIKNDCAAANE